MRRNLRALAIVACLFVSVDPSASAQEIEVLRPSGLWVTDNAGLLSDGEERQLSSKLEAFAKTSSTQIVVVTLPALDGVAPADYAVELGRSWGVGQEGYDNGVVMLVSRDDREVFIATGYGLEGAITDATAGRIVRNVLVPNFRQGNFYEGLSLAADALIAAAEGEYTPEDAAERNLSLDVLVLLIILIVLIVIIILLSRREKASKKGGSQKRKRRRRGGGPVIIWGGGGRRSGWGGSGGFGGGGSFGGSFGGGFSGGGGSFGGGGAGGSW